MVYDLSDSDWEKLKRAEGGYCQADVEVVVYGDDEALLASTFVSNWGSSAIGDPDSFYPTKRYLGLIKEGAKVHQLDKEYQKWLQDLQTVSQMDVSISFLLIIIIIVIICLTDTLTRCFRLLIVTPAGPG